MAAGESCCDELGERALLAADTDRIGEMLALGLDEILFCRRGRLRKHYWATSIVDVHSCWMSWRAGQLEHQAVAVTAAHRLAGCDTLGCAGLLGAVPQYL